MVCGTPQEWQARSQQREKQHLKFLQQRFRGILSGTYARMNLEQMEQETKPLWGSSPYAEFWVEWSTAVRSHRGGVLRLAQALCGAIALGHYSVQNPFDPLAQAHNSEADRMATALQHGAQQRSVLGVLGFLLFPRNAPMLHLLYFYGMFDYLAYAEKFPRDFPLPSSPGLIQQFHLWVVTDLIGIIAAVPWTQAAEAYRKQGKIPESMQSKIRPRLQGLKAIQEINAGKYGIFG